MSSEHEDDTTWALWRHVLLSFISATIDFHWEEFLLSVKLNNGDAYEIIWPEPPSASGWIVNGLSFNFEWTIPMKGFCCCGVCILFSCFELDHICVQGWHTFCISGSRGGRRAVLECLVPWDPQRVQFQAAARRPQQTVRNRNLKSNQLKSLSLNI